MRTVLARFAGGSSKFSYFVPEGDNPQVGDLLLTSIGLTSEEMLNRLKHNFGGGGATGVWAVKASVATVVEVEKVANLRATKFYVQLLPYAAIKARQAENKAMAAEMKRREAIQAQLDELADQEDKRTRYARLAATNPQAAALLAELDSKVAYIAPEAETGWVSAAEAAEVSEPDELLDEHKHKPKRTYDPGRRRGLSGAGHIEGEED